jgi:hypothetical protein
MMRIVSDADCNEETYECFVDDDACTLLIQRVVGGNTTSSEEHRHKCQEGNEGLGTRGDME